MVRQKSAKLLYGSSILPAASMFKYKNILVTGGAGFIGSHFVRYLLSQYKDVNVVNVDLLTYCGNPENLKDVSKNPRYRFYKADIGDLGAMAHILKRNNIDCVVNFAAESDNNKATNSPIDFPSTNVLGTSVLLEASRQYGKLKRFHHISTCEVFGELPLNSTAKFTEDSPLKPRTPYNASKGGADLMVKSYFHTFGLPITISHTANNYGSHQFPEKVIPVFTLKALSGQPLTLFKSTGNKREWIHVLDNCRGIDLVLQKGKTGESYNIGTGLEKSILDIADEVLDVLKVDKNLKKIIPDRPGHDSRYLLDSSKIRKLGWKPKIAWKEGLTDTVNWYKNNSKWWKPLLAKSNSWR